jgi:type IV pilus assembly protein PilC
MSPARKAASAKTVANTTKADAPVKKTGSVADPASRAPSDVAEAGTVTQAVEAQPPQPSSVPEGQPADASKETAGKPSSPSHAAATDERELGLRETSNIRTEKFVKKKNQFYIRGIPPAEIEFSLRHMSMMLRSGLSLTESLAVIVEQLSDERLRETYSNILTEVQEGKNIADAMAEYPKIFSDVVVSIVRISEQTGTLESNLLYLAEYLKKNYELSRKVKGALIYPFIVLGMTGAEMFGVMFFIMPKMETMFAAFENVPAFSMAIVNGASFIRKNLLYFIMGLVVFGFGFFRFTKTAAGKRFMDKLAIIFPIIRNLNRKNILASFARTLGMLLESGIPIQKSVEITAQTMSNLHYAEAVKKISKDVKEGNNLADSMMKFKNYFPIAFIRIVQAGERTGTLEENLAYMYDSYSGEVEEMANNMVTLLEPLLLILAGAMIGLLAITIVAPIYQFTSSIN